MGERWPVLVPRETVNDDFVILIRWAVADGQHVEAGTTIAEIETSKANVELTAERTGWVRHAVREMEQVAVGAPIGSISSEPGTTNETPAAAPAAPAGAATFSKKARELIEANRLDPRLFEGRGLVREQDVLQVLERGPSAPASPSRSGRAAVARTVPLSAVKRTEIRYLTEGNTAALVSAITVLVRTRALDRAIARRSASRRLTYLDFVVPALAHEIATFPELNGFYARDGVHHYADVNVGVAMNLDRGLVVPVLRGAAGKAPEDVSRELGTLAMRCVRGELGEADLVGGTITVTDLSAAGAFQVLPLLNRDQAAILALGQDADLSLLSLTLAFDHRVSDGQRATQLLRALKERLEAGDGDAEPATASLSAACSSCFITLDRLRADGVTGFLLSVMTSEGTPGWLCPVCLAGWNG